MPAVPELAEFGYFHTDRQAERTGTEDGHRGQRGAERTGIYTDKSGAERRMSKPTTKRIYERRSTQKVSIALKARTLRRAQVLQGRRIALGLSSEAKEVSAGDKERDS